MRVEIEISSAHLRHVLRSAHISYWGEYTKFVDGKLANCDDLHCLVVEEDSKRMFVVSGPELRNAIAVAAQKFPHLVEALLDDRKSDMYTGDLLVQLACFGEEKYA